MQQNTTKNQAGERTHTIHTFSNRGLLGAISPEYRQKVATKDTRLAPPTPAKTPWTRTTIYRKGKMAYNIVRQHTARGGFTGTIECPGLLYQRGLSLQTIEQLELLLLAEGYQKLP